MPAVVKTIENDHVNRASYVTVKLAPAKTDDIKATYNYLVTKTIADASTKLGTGTGFELEFQTAEAKPAAVDTGTYSVRKRDQQGQESPIGATLSKGANNRYSLAFPAGTTFAAGDSVILDYRAQAKDEPVGAELKDGSTTTFDLKNPRAIQAGATVTLGGAPHTPFTISSDTTKSQITITKSLPEKTEITVDYLVGGLMKGQPVPRGGTDPTLFKLSDNPVLPDPKSFQVWVNGRPESNVQVIRKSDGFYLQFSTAPTGPVTADYTMFAFFKPVPTGTAVLCTSFSDYKRSFGDFSSDRMQNYLTHAVYGYFNNGGTRCYVIRAQDKTPPSTDAFDAAFNALDRIEDISIVVAPGITDDTARGVIVARCSRKGDRFAIFDSPETVDKLDKLTRLAAADGVMPQRTDVAAWYFPWIKTFDPVTKTLNPDGDGTINVPPSGHIAGVYARVDTQRGVHKAPANEAVLGALGVARPLSKAEQDGLNPKGVNCIRVINDSVLLWGARTVGGDMNTDLKYINVKRTLLFLKKSINEGTQWVVFEPNSPALWQTITRNVTAFLTSVWRSGALFGNTPQEAFYVKCDAETNPKDARETGQIITEIGVAIVRPAEFVIFRISQWAGPGQ
ncbi:MAG TPA: phage tail sheath subtilisin-like domain-containing protein [Blastocatellia bacterium]|nr:phage tail sheath subtilisin-like domain-containing protein [Blastocatellia bacterium]